MIMTNQQTPQHACHTRCPRTQIMPLLLAGSSRYARQARGRGHTEAVASYSPLAQLSARENNSTHMCISEFLVFSHHAKMHFWNARPLTRAARWNSMLDNEKDKRNLCSRFLRGRATPASAIPQGTSSDRISKSFLRQQVFHARERRAARAQNITNKTHHKA